MKFTVAKTAILAELNLLSDIISEGRKNTIAALSCVRITTIPNAIEIVATDISTTLQTICEAEVDVPGVAVVDAKRLTNVVAALETAEIKFTIGSNGWVRLNDHFSIGTQPEEAFPKPPEIPDGHPHKIRASVIAQLIARTAFAVAAKPEQYSLDNAMLTCEGDKVSLGGFDGFIMSEVTWQNEGVGSAVIAIPRKGLKPLSRLAAKGEGDIEVTLGPNQTFFKLDNRILAVGLMTGQFPPYRNVIPKSNLNVAAISVDKFTTLLKRAALASPEKPARRVTLEIKPGLRDKGEGMLYFSAQSNDSSDEEEMEISYRGEAVRVIVDPDKLMHFLSVVPGEMITLALKDSNTMLSMPMLFKFHNDALEHTFVLASCNESQPEETEAAGA